MKISRRLLQLTAQQTAKYLEHYSHFHPLPLSVQTLVNFGVDREGTPEASFEFLRKELPVRLANIMQEIKHLPTTLLRMPSVVCVNDWYHLSFKELCHFAPMTKVMVTDDLLDNFYKTLTHIRDRHSSVVETMAQGMIELKDSFDIDANMAKCIQYFLDRFYMNRISIRMLINHHTLLFGSHKLPQSHLIGCIDPECNIRKSVEEAYDNAKFLCEQYYEVAPDLHIECRDADNRTTPDVDIMYIPSHLYHMLFELFKNAMRATVEHHSGASSLPPIRVLICKGSEDLCIKMSDLGGGIPRSKGELLFQYMYSTAPEPLVCDGGSAPLAGYGYGLPISRLYARYLHGDLILNSVEGHGTDAHIYLKAMSDVASEVLPVYNRTASKMYVADTPVNDWSSPQPWSPVYSLQRGFSTATTPTTPRSPVGTTTPRSPVGATTPRSPVSATTTPHSSVGTTPTPQSVPTLSV